VFFFFFLNTAAVIFFRYKGSVLQHDKRQPLPEVVTKMFAVLSRVLTVTPIYIINQRDVTVDISTQS